MRNILLLVEPEEGGSIGAAILLLSSAAPSWILLPGGRDVRLGAHSICVHNFPKIGTRRNENPRGLHPVKTTLDSLHTRPI